MLYSDFKKPLFILKMLKIFLRHSFVLFNQVKSPCDLLLYFNSLSDKEVREIVLVKDDCPPSFVFNHEIKIGDVALKCN